MESRTTRYDLLQYISAQTHFLFQFHGCSYFQLFLFFPLRLYIRCIARCRLVVVPGDVPLSPLKESGGG